MQSHTSMIRLFEIIPHKQIRLLSLVPSLARVMAIFSINAKEEQRISSARYQPFLDSLLATSPPKFFSLLEATDRRPFAASSMPHLSNVVAHPSDAALTLWETDVCSKQEACRTSIQTVSTRLLLLESRRPPPRRAENVAFQQSNGDSPPTGPLSPTDLVTVMSIPGVSPSEVFTRAYVVSRSCKARGYPFLATHSGT